MGKKGKVVLSYVRRGHPGERESTSKSGGGKDSTGTRKEGQLEKRDEHTGAMVIGGQAKRPNLTKKKRNLDEGNTSGGQTKPPGRESIKPALKKGRTQKTLTQRVQVDTLRP